MSPQPLCLAGLFVGSSPLEQSPYKVLRSDPPGGLHKHNELNRSDGRSDHSANAAQFEVTSPSDRLVHPVKMTVHKSKLLSNIGSSIKDMAISAEDISN